MAKKAAAPATITLKHLAQDDPLPTQVVEPLELRFDRITVCLGDERHTFLLQGTPIENRIPGGQDGDL